MVIKNRGSNSMFIDLKNGVDHMSKDVMDAAVRELPRALKMAPAEDIVNLVLSGANMYDIKRDDPDSALLAKVLTQQKEMGDTLSQLRTQDVKQKKIISELRDELDNPPAE